MSQISEEVDRVWELLSLAELNISYNDSTGIHNKHYMVDFYLPILEVDGGGTDPREAARQKILPLLEADFADTELVIHSAVVYRQYQIDFSKDRYGFWVEVVV